MTTPPPSEAYHFIKTRTASLPRMGLILGSGLGGLASKIENRIEIPYRDIPGFQSTHAVGHQGCLIFGSLEGVSLVVMAGRFHRYEGYSTQQVTFPVEVMKLLGIEELVITNAAGGINPQLNVGDIIILRDHINWLGGVISPSQQMDAQEEWNLATHRHASDFYSRKLSEQAFEIARQNNLPIFPGTYLGTLGPTYETRSEYRMMKAMGADVVGMSSIPEALMGKQLGIDPLVLSIVTNVATPDQQNIADHDEVLLVGQKTSAFVEILIRNLLQSL